MKSLKKAVLKRSSSGAHAVSTSAPPQQEEDDDSFEDASEVLMHVDAHDEGGLAFSNKQLLDSQRGAIMEIAKDAGRKLLTGSFNLINLSMPVKMSEPRSYLQKLTDVWVYPRLLQKAADAQDPVERLRWVATWFTAGLQHVFQSWKKPFNPILGETWQATQEDGSGIFMEQISHHPAISAFQMIGPGGAYTFTGHSQPDVQYKGNAIKTMARGYRSIYFRDGDHRIDIIYPAYYMRGILYSTMPRGDMSGPVTFTDASRRLCCELQFGEMKDSEDPLLRRSDTVQGLIYSLPPGWKKDDPVPTMLASARPAKGFFSRMSDPGGASSRESAEDLQNVRAGCNGNWLSHLDWDGTRYWTLVEEQPALWQPVADPLPSDSRFRLDLATLLSGDLVGAQAAKEALEQRQRHEAKLRKEGGASN